MWFKFAVLIAVGFSAGAVAQESIRLPGHTRPLHYDIELNVNIHNGSLPYVAKVVIKIAVDVSTDVITLHNKGLPVTGVKVIDKTGEDSYDRLSRDISRDFLFITVDKALIVGDEYTLEVSFNGNIATSNTGFYRMSYRKTETNEIR